MSKTWSIGTSIDHKNYVDLLTRAVACVASVSSRGSSRKLGQEQKKKFRVITRLETLATQATRAGLFKAELR